MTKYLERSFTVSLGSKAYSDNWDAVFGKKDESQPPPPAAPPKSDRFPIYRAIEEERVKQDLEYGGPDHDDHHPPGDWESFIKDHLNRAMRGIRDPERYRRQMLRVAALAVAAVEVHDRKNTGS